MVTLRGFRIDSTLCSESSGMACQFDECRFFITLTDLMRPKGGYVYFVSNRYRTVLYCGVTSALYIRAYQHKNGEGGIFSSRYNCTDLVYFEYHDSIEVAIEREKQLKKWKRAWKEELIRKMNPEMRDLFPEVEEMQ